MASTVPASTDNPGRHRDPDNQFAVGTADYTARHARGETPADRYQTARAQGRDQVESLARALIPGIPS